MGSTIENSVKIKKGEKIFSMPLRYEYKKEYTVTISVALTVSPTNSGNAFINRPMKSRLCGIYKETQPISGAVKMRAKQRNRKDIASRNLNEGCHSPRLKCITCVECGAVDRHKKGGPPPNQTKSQLVGQW